MSLLMPGFAHAFGQSYTLPIPLWLFLFAAAASIVVSFVVISWFVEVKPAATRARQPGLAIGWLIPAAKVFGVTVFWLMVFSGLMSVGAFSLIVIWFWVLIMIGLMYLVALFGDIWQYLNPFQTMFEGLERVLGKQTRPLLRYPKRLSYYPALITYGGVIWLELMSDGLGIVPDKLAYILLCYATLTVVAAWLFGKKDWFTYGEFFSVFYALVARVSSVVLHNKMATLRKPLAGVSSAETVRFSILIFILFMLASTGYDNFRETTLFWDFASIWLTRGSNISWIYELVLLVALTLGLLLFYLGSIVLMRRIAPTKMSVFDLAKRFALPLLPIAIGYHMAHYFPLLLTNGPLAFNYLGDPLQLGWNIAGLGQAEVVTNIYDATLVWYGQVSLIIGAHIAALYASHRTAGQLFRGRRIVVRSQYPIAALMVLYTVGSLWLLQLALAV